jgi:hypothetical protein
MNRQRSIAVLVLLCFLAACASGPERISYTSINGAVDAVQTALKAWHEGFYQPGLKVDPTKWNTRRDAIGDKYAAFQKSAHLAATLAQDVSQRETAIKTISDAAADLIALITLLEKP